MNIWELDTDELSDDTADLYDGDLRLSPTDDPEGDSLIDEFVEIFNARDLDGMAELFASDVGAGFVFANGSASAVQSLESLFLREPSVTLTRGELASEPLAAVWHAVDGDFVCVGYLVFEFTDDVPALIARIELVDEIESDDLLIETPDDAELPEWELDEDDWETKGGEHL